MPLPLVRRVVLLPLLLLAGCDTPVTAPAGEAAPPPARASAALACAADVRTASLTCADAAGSAAGARASIIGGQGVNVRLTSQNASYDSATQRFRVEVNVQNLLPAQTLGTYDGSTLAGIQVFFHTSPTATRGAGQVALANADGADLFTGSGQPFFTYGAILAPGGSSGFRPWEFTVPPSVEAFHFSVYVDAPAFTEGSRPPVYGTFTEMSVSGSHSCGLVADGRAFCWGYGGSGRLGNGVTRSFFDPAPVVGGLTFKQVSAGGAHTCALTTGGKAYCWGDNGAGQVGAPAEIERGGFTPARYNRSPVAVQGGHTFASLDAGGGSACGLDADGRGWCWGANGVGQLGTGAVFDSTSVPVAVTGDHRFTQLRVAPGYACGVKADGELWCWGSNATGQLGLPCPERCGATEGVVAGSAVPVRFPTDLRFAAFDPGALHICALTTGGQAWCWGNEVLGVLGGAEVSTLSTHVPQEVQTDERFTEVAVGSQESCAIRLDGALVCWGWQEPVVGNNEPRRYAGPWVSISPDHTHKCGVTAYGNGLCWGREQYGELGNADHHENSATLPAAVAPLHVYDLPPRAGFNAIASSRAYTFQALTGDLDRDFPSYSNDDYGVVRFLWSFGDGTTGEGQYINHSYARNGSYQVTLTVVDASGQRGMMTYTATPFFYEGP